MFQNKRFFKEESKVELSETQIDEIKIFKNKLESKEYILEDIEYS